MSRLCVLALFATAALRGHEIGTTRVSVLFQNDKTYSIEIVTDAKALSEKLAIMSGRTPVADESPAGLESQIRASGDVFRQRVKIAFDEVESRPVVAFAVAPAVSAASPALATIRLTGGIPAGAHQFAWRYAWTFASYSLSVRNSPADNPSTQWLEGGEASKPFLIQATRTPADWLATGWRYLSLGFTHILPNGLDHMLFVLGLYLLNGRFRSVLWQVSAFTVAHSITLGLSLYGIVTVPSRVVEPLIAVSIAYVAIENIFLSELKSWRIALVFAFGLLHGLGFAGALQELGLPRSEFLIALLSFNVGVEGGQLAVIGTAFLLTGWYFARRPWYRVRIAVPASAMIAITAIYWAVERLSA